MTPAIPQGIPLANAEGKEALPPESLPKRAGTPQPARHKLLPAHVEGVLGAGVKTSSERHVRVANPLQNPEKLSALGI